MSPALVILLPLVILLNLIRSLTQKNVIRETRSAQTTTRLTR
jgi:hypothetical protein